MNAVLYMRRYDIMRSNSSTHHVTGDVYSFTCFSITQTYWLHGAYHVVEFLLMVLTCCLFLPTTIFNSIAVSVFALKHKMNTLQHTLFVNTSVCDLLVGFVCVPVRVTNLLLLLVFRHHYCLLYVIDVVSLNILVWLLFMTMFFVSIDRYLAIVQNHSYLGNKRLAGVYQSLICLTWVVIPGLHALCFFFIGYDKVYYLVFITPVLILYGIYAHLRAFCVVHFEQKKLRDVGLSSSVQSGENKRVCSIIREAKTARMTSLLFFVACCCYVPFFVFTLLPFLKYKLGKQLFQFFSIAAECTQVLAISKSLLNPLVFYYKNVSVRLTIRRVFGLERRSSSRGSPVESPYPTIERDAELTIENKDSLSMQTIVQ